MSFCPRKFFYETAMISNYMTLYVLIHEIFMINRKYSYASDHWDLCFPNKKRLCHILLQITSSKIRMFLRNRDTINERKCSCSERFIFFVLFFRDYSRIPAGSRHVNSSVRELVRVYMHST